jgi:multiple sugar transport system ATP-binding protein
VLRDGVLQQVDTPQRLYEHPVNLFVAAFIGSPPMNLVEAEVRGRTLAFGGLEMQLAPQTNLEEFEGRSVILGIRPSDMEDAEVWRNQDLPTIEGRR